jgi:hypothetical protein
MCRKESHQALSNTGKATLTSSYPPKRFIELISMQIKVTNAQWHVSAGVAGHNSTHAIASVCKVNVSALFDHGLISDGDHVQVRQIPQEEIVLDFLVSASGNEASAQDPNIYRDSASTCLQTYWSCPLRQYLAELREVSVLRTCVNCEK